MIRSRTGKVRPKLPVRQPKPKGRPRLDEDTPPRDMYQVVEEDPTEFFSSGCTLLDRVLGQGWALGRVSNVYGDSATGKTLVGIEACANFARKYKDGEVFYRERESAFDLPYAGSIGLPLDRVKLKSYETGLVTLEDLYDDMNACVKELRKSGAPGIYCIDSLDAFPDMAELEADIRDNNQVAKKGRIMSQIFRLITGEVHQTRMHMMFISQIRAKIGATYGRKTEMAGGTAIRFYASQRIFMKHIGFITPTVKGVERPVGINVNVKNEKSKVGMPYRECQFPILFGWGIDDLKASLTWLKVVGELDQVEGINVKSKTAIADYVKATYDIEDNKEYRARLRGVSRLVKEVWDDIEDITQARHYPSRSKY